MHFAEIRKRKENLLQSARVKVTQLNALKQEHLTALGNDRTMRPDKGVIVQSDSAGRVTLFFGTGTIQCSLERG